MLSIVHTADMTMVVARCSQGDTSSSDSRTVNSLHSHVCSIGIQQEVGTGKQQGVVAAASGAHGDSSTCLPPRSCAALLTLCLHSPAGACV
jgi:hypothetical protein